MSFMSKIRKSMRRKKKSPAERSSASTSAANSPSSSKSEIIPEVVDGRLYVIVKEGDLEQENPSYCVLECDSHQTKTKKLKGSAPKWNQQIIFDVTSAVEKVDVWVYECHAEMESCIGLGTLYLRGESWETDSKVESWVDLKETRKGSKLAMSEPEMKLGRIEVEAKFVPSPAHKIVMDDFNIHAVIGRGGFGKVMLVEKKDTSNLYALKVLKKKDLADRGEIAHTVCERKVLATSANPFMVELKFSFQTPDKLYLVLDFVQGGELFTHLQKEGTFSFERTRLYAAQMCDALNYLHKNSIIYRDLKPENVLFDLNGYIKLIDFGLSKQFVESGKTATFCGTPEYLAPEVLEHKVYGVNVDWWSLGNLVFEMLTGLPPFYDENHNTMFQNILEAKVKFPKECNEKARDFIARLLKKVPEDRISDYDKIKKLPFFKGLNWKNLLSKSIKMPWKPIVESNKDISNFDAEYTTQKAEDSASSPHALNFSLAEQFAGFSFAGDKQDAK